MRASFRRGVTLTVSKGARCFPRTRTPAPLCAAGSDPSRPVPFMDRLRPPLDETPRRLGSCALNGSVHCFARWNRGAVERQPPGHLAALADRVGPPNTSRAAFGQQSRSIDRSIDPDLAARWIGRHPSSLPPPRRTLADSGGHASTNARAMRTDASPPPSPATTGGPVEREYNGPCGLPPPPFVR
jgi:hypothetical protein